MISTLIALIFYSKIFRKKEKNLMLAETNYLDALTNYMKKPVESLKNEVIHKGLEYGKLLGMSEENALDMVNKDFAKVSL